MTIETLTIDSAANRVRRIYISRGEGKKGSHGIKSGKRMGLRIGGSIYWLEYDFTAPSELNHILLRFNVQISERGGWGFFDDKGDIGSMGKKAVRINQLHDQLFSDRSVYFKRYKAKNSKNLFWDLYSLVEHLTYCEVPSGQDLIKAVETTVKYGIKRKHGLSCSDDSGTYGSGIYFTVSLPNNFKMDVVLKAVMKREGETPNSEGGISKHHTMQDVGFGAGYIKHPDWYEPLEVEPSGIEGLAELNEYLKHTFDGFRYCQEYNRHGDMVNEYHAYRKTNL